MSRSRIWSWTENTGLTSTLNFKPQYQHVYSLHCSPYVSYCTVWENLSKYQDIFSVLIIPLILFTWTFHLAITLLGEILCWSPLYLASLPATPARAARKLSLSAPGPSARKMRENRSTEIFHLAITRSGDHISTRGKDTSCLQTQRAYLGIACVAK